MKCQYKSDYSKSCDKEVYQNSYYCALHTDFPKDKNSMQYKLLLLEKIRIFEEKIENNDFNFAGTTLKEINLSDKIINQDLVLSDCKIYGNVMINGSSINGNVFFNSSVIFGTVELDSNFEPYKKTKINGTLDFRGATLKQQLFCRDIIIMKDLKFHDSTVDSVLRCSGAKIDGQIWLFGSKFGSFIEFDNASIGTFLCSHSEIERFGSFYNNTFNGLVNINNSTFRMRVCFNNAKFLGDTEFDNINFCKKVIFYNSTFTSNRARFKRLKQFNANFEAAKLHNTYFRHCDLTNVRFKDVIFENCELYTSKLPNKIIEHKEYEKNKRRLENNTPPKISNKKTLLTDHTLLTPSSLIEYANEVADIYRRIRQCLENQGAYMEAGEFYKKEMNFRKAEVYKKSNRSLFLTYTILNWISSYGENSLKLAILIILYYGLAVYIAHHYNLPKTDYTLYFTISIIPIGSFLIALFVYSFARKMSR